LKSDGVTVGGLCGVGLNNEPEGKAEEMWRQYRLITEAVTSLQASSSAQRSDLAVSSNKLQYCTSLSVIIAARNWW